MSKSEYFTDAVISETSTFHHHKAPHIWMWTRLSCEIQSYALTGIPNKYPISKQGCYEHVAVSDSRWCSGVILRTLEFFGVDYRLLGVGCLPIRREFSEFVSWARFFSETGSYEILRDNLEYSSSITLQRHFSVDVLPQVDIYRVERGSYEIILREKL